MTFKETFIELLLNVLDPSRNDVDAAFAKYHFRRDVTGISFINVDPATNNCNCARCEMIRNRKLESNNIGVNDDSRQI